MEYRNLSIILRLSSGALLILALLSWPYGYYQFLRIYICASSLFLTWYFKEVNIPALSYAFVLPAIIFNPIFPFYFGKEFWHILDLAFGLFFLVTLSVGSGKPKSN